MPKRKTECQIFYKFDKSGKKIKTMSFSGGIEEAAQFHMKIFEQTPSKNPPKQPKAKKPTKKAAKPKPQTSKTTTIVSQSTPVTTNITAQSTTKTQDNPPKSQPQGSDFPPLPKVPRVLLISDSIFKGRLNEKSSME